MPRAILIDDERLARRELRVLLDRTPGIEIVGEAGTVPEARALLARSDPDIVFLDIRLGKLSGFDLVEAVPAECAIVFVTAYDEHALRAFEVNALDYLLKPVDPAKLARAIERVREQPGTDSQAPGDPVRLTEADWLFLPFGESRTFLLLKQITHLTADGDYVIAQTRDGRAVRTSTSLAAWERRLPASFLRIHRNTIVNLHYVTAVVPWSHASYQLTLQGLNAPLTMSRRYAHKAKTLLG